MQAETGETALTNLNNFNMRHFWNLSTSLKTLVKGGGPCSLVFILVVVFIISVSKSMRWFIIMTFMTYY